MTRRPNTRNRNWILEIFTMRRTYDGSETFREEVISIQADEGSLNEMCKLRNAMRALTAPHLYDGGECHYAISRNPVVAHDEKIRKENRLRKAVWDAECSARRIGMVI